MNFFIMVSLILSVLLGIFRGIDLALLTDAETGLCIVGSPWPSVPLWRRAAAVSRSLTRCGDTARLPASWHWRQRSAMVRPLCCASSGCTAAW